MVRRLAVHATVRLSQDPSSGVIAKTHLNAGGMEAHDDQHHDQNYFCEFFCHGFNLIICHRLKQQEVQKNMVLIWDFTNLPVQNAKFSRC